MQRLFDIAKIYGGDVVLPPINNKKKTVTKTSPPREQKSKSGALGPAKSGKSVPGFMSLADQEAERLEAIRRKVRPAPRLSVSLEHLQSSARVSVSSMCPHVC